MSRRLFGKEKIADKRIVFPMTFHIYQDHILFRSPQYSHVAVLTRGRLMDRDTFHIKKDEIKNHCSPYLLKKRSKTMHTSSCYKISEGINYVFALAFSDGQLASANSAIPHISTYPHILILALWRITDALREKLWHGRFEPDILLWRPRSFKYFCFFIRSFLI